MGKDVYLKSIQIKTNNVKYEINMRIRTFFDEIIFFEGISTIFFNGYTPSTFHQLLSQIKNLIILVLFIHINHLS